MIVNHIVKGTTANLSQMINGFPTIIYGIYLFVYLIIKGGRELSDLGEVTGWICVPEKLCQVF